MSDGTIRNRPLAKTSSECLLFHSVGDLDQLREVIHGASLEVLQLGSGTLQGQLTHVFLPNSSLHSNRFSIAARGIGSSCPHRWSFLTFPDGGVGSFNGIPLGQNMLLAYPPNSEFVGTIGGPGRFVDWGFTVTGEKLEAAYFAFTGQELTALNTHVTCLQPTEKPLREFRNLVRRSLAIAEQQTGSFELTEDIDRLENRLTHSLVETIASTDSRLEETDVTGNSYEQIVRLVHEFLTEYQAAPVSLAEIGVLVGVSERTLRRAFESVVGLSPSRFCKIVRLNRAYVELAQQTDSEASVTEMALRWGMNHLGRFAEEYKQLFGELPSKTLGRKGTRRRVR